MFNLDNFELDIDDDFSSNLFGIDSNSTSKNAVESRNEICVDKSISGCINEESKQFPKQPSGSVSSSDFLDFPFLKDCEENSLKRSFVQDERPQKKRLSNQVLIQRKFPGPAGLLPDKPFREISHLPLSEENFEDKENEEDREKSIVFSQDSGSVFSGSSYQKLVSDFSLNELNNPLNRYTVGWVKKTALNKGLRGRKIPFLGLVIHTVNHTLTDPVLVLRDTTGEIHGSLHREVWADLGGKLRGGNALALRQVGVLITGVIRRQIHLNITMNNILAVYSFNESDDQVETTTVNKVSKSELMKSFEQWLAQPLKNSPAKPASSPPLFTTIDNKNSSTNKEIKNLKNKLQNFVNQSKEKRAKVEERNSGEVLANLGIVLSESDFNEEMKIPQQDSTPVRGSLQPVGGATVCGGESSQALSQDESLIFEEVLSGIDLDEFEM